MYCLRWWIPLFLLPFPTAPPAFLILFVIAYVFHTRPCAYCGVIVLGLFVSSCYWYLDLVPAEGALRSASADSNGAGGAALGDANGGLSGAGTERAGAPGGVQMATSALGGTGGGGTTLAQQVAMAAFGLWASAGVQAVVPQSIASWLGPVRLRNASLGVSGEGSQGASGVLSQTASSSQAGAGRSVPSLRSHEGSAATSGNSGNTWLGRLNPLPRWPFGASDADKDAADNSESCGLAEDDSSCGPQGPPSASNPDTSGTSHKNAQSTDARLTSSPWSGQLLAKCPGSGRCWLDFALTSTYGLFEPVPCYRLPEGGCQSEPASAGKDAQGRPNKAISKKSSSSSSSSWPTLQELLEDAKRQLDEERAAHESLRRRIEEEQAEVEQAVVAAERDAEDDDLGAASSAAPASAAASSSTTSSTTPRANRDTAKSKREKKERQSRAARIQSRSRKPAFRRADPELDGEHTRGTYWIGVPGTAVGAFFDFALR